MRYHYTSVLPSILVLAALVTACGGPITRPPTPDMLAESREEGQVIVLLRVAARGPAEAPIEPFEHFFKPEANIQLALGDFDTGGFPEKKVLPILSLSADSLAKGWIYMILPPGLYYLSVQPPRLPRRKECFKSGPRWTFEIPENTAVAYIGSLYFPAEEGWFMIFLSSVVTSMDVYRSQIRNEEEEAKKLASEYLGDLGLVRTVLMERHTSDTFILRTPPASPSD